MTSPTSGLLRWSRALAFGATAFAVSVAAHVAAGGTAPGLLWSGALLVACTWVGLFLTAGRLRASVIAPALGTTQLVLHQVMMWTESTSGVVGGCLGAMSSHHGAAPSTASCVTATATSTAGDPVAMTHAAHLPGGTWAMLAAHTLATLALAVILRRGEDAVWFLARLVWAALPSTARPPAPTRLVLHPVAGLAPRHTAAVPGSVGRRGPPRAPALATC